MKKIERLNNTKIELVILLLAGVVCLISLFVLYGPKKQKEFISSQEKSWERILVGEEEKEAPPVPIVRPSTEGTTTIPILVYHKFRSSQSTQPQSALARAFSVDEEVFDQQLTYIESQHYTVLTMRELVRDEETHTVPDKPLVLTFDDGWKNQYSVALPLLQKHSMHGTFYIYTGVIGSHAFMSWEELRSLVSAGMEIGDHTKNHPRLAKIDPSRLEIELLESKRLLESTLGISITSLAYPYGSYNDAIIAVAKQYGYLSGRTSNHSLYNDFKNPYALNVIYAPKSLEGLKEMLH